MMIRVRIIILTPIAVFILIPFMVVHIAILIMMRNLGERAYNFAWVASRTPNVDDLCDGLEQASVPDILDLRASNEVQNVV